MTKICVFDVDGVLQPGDAAKTFYERLFSREDYFPAIIKDYLREMRRKSGLGWGYTEALYWGQALEKLYKRLVGRKREEVVSLMREVGNELKAGKGAPEVVKQLQDNDIEVYAITGSFRDLALSICTKLGIRKENVYGLKLYADEEGKITLPPHPLYAGPYKIMLIEFILQSKDTRPRDLVFVGDGTTDIDAVVNAHKVGYRAIA